tara:strand:- start:1813 stop:2286 length:474 start_codon:yes stop_codon:yes gene_type:complete
METTAGFLTETSVMLEYIEDLCVGESLYPTDAFNKAKCRELLRYLELYIELPARRLYGDVFFGRPASDAEKATVRKLLEKGFSALGRIAKFEPYFAGAELTYVDFYAFFGLSPVFGVCKKVWTWDAMNEITGIKPLFDLMNERDSVSQVKADQASNT